MQCLLTERGDKAAKNRSARIFMCPAKIRALIAAVFLAPFLSHARAESDLRTPSLDWPARLPATSNVLRAVKTFTLEIEDADMAFDVGASLLLFDISPDFYVGIVRDEGARMNKLVAVPRTGGGEGTAWLTNEKQIIFGRRTRSCAGLVFIRKNETMPITAESADSYSAILERYTRRMRCDIPKSLKAFVVEKAPEPAPEEIVTKRELAVATTNVPPPPVQPPVKIVQTPKPPPPTTYSQPVTHVQSPQRVFINKEEPVQIVPEIVFEKSAPETKWPAAVTSRPAATAPLRTNVVTAAVTKNIAPETQIAAAIPPPVATAAVVRIETTNVPPASTATVARIETTNARASIVTVAATNREPILTAAPVRTNRAANANIATAKPPPAVPPQGRFSLLNVWTIFILVMTVAAETAIIARLFMRKKLLAKLGPAMQADALERDMHGDISGRLERFPLPQLVQFFNGNKESGTLSIAGKQGIEARLIFERGQIIDADTTLHFGLPAAEEILRRKEGTFRFRVEDNSMRAKNIHQDTIALLMEVARDMDEAPETSDA